MSHIFISYSKKNRDYARPLADHLLSLGFDVWIDDQIDYGDDWWRVIVRAIRGAKAFIVVMTDESDASDWVQREVTLADKNKIPAFPIWLSGDVDASENWAIYVRTQYADVRDGSLPKDDYYMRLAKVAPRKSNQGNDITDSPPAKQSSEGIKGNLEAKPIRERDTIQAKIPETSLPDVSALTAATLSILPPPFDWCPIPAGKVTIEYSASDHQTFNVPAFAIAKYPITNAQYQAFVDAKDGYHDRRWWDYSYDAESWRRDNPKPGTIAYPGDDLPRTNVSWYESVAFTRWLDVRISSPRADADAEGQGVRVSLPGEQQWQRAAQGDDNRIYPWGKEFDKTCCNTRESDMGQPTPVTWYPSGVSPFGVFDLSGNIWEWCLTTRNGDSTKLRGDSYRVVHGGSFGNFLDFARVVYRDISHPGGRGNSFGFRVVYLPPSP